jgi:tRNA-dihydrouridine synthase B
VVVDAAPFPLFLAPMAGVTNSVFRSLCKEKGADVLTSEFVSAEGIMHRNARTRDYLEFSEGERPMGVQLFGADPERLAEAARQVVDWVAPDFIDINFGCPANKVVCRNGGSSLLRDRPLLGRVASAVVSACAPLPVTAKIRIGWDAASVNAVETARLLEETGVSRIAVHGRTRAQGYSGAADWEVIAAVAASVAVPVIGNGDIAGAEDALRRRGSGVAGLMIGRAAMSNPWIFTEIKCALAGKPYSPPDLADRWALVLRHAREEAARRGELHGMRGMRGRLMAYSRGMPGGRQLRSLLSSVASLAELEDIAAGHLGDVAAREAPRPLNG